MIKWMMLPRNERAGKSKSSTISSSQRQRQRQWQRSPGGTQIGSQLHQRQQQIGVPLPAVSPVSPAAAFVATIIAVVGQKVTAISAPAE